MHQVSSTRVLQAESVSIYPKSKVVVIRSDTSDHRLEPVIAEESPDHISTRQADNPAVL